MNIKCRGKRIENGEMIEGYYGYKDLSDEHFIIVPTFDTRGDIKRPQYFTDYLVQPDSISRNTTLKDKHGKEIYEGDICKYVILAGQERVNPLQALLVVIEWKNASWGYRHLFPEFVVEEDREWKSFWRSDEEEMWNNKYFEVIGNIYENSELLKA